MQRLSRRVGLLRPTYSLQKKMLGSEERAPPALRYTYRMSRRLILLLFIAVPTVAQPAIKPIAIASHIRFLASDTLEGRETGTRGYDVAAEYVRAQFEAIGLQPLRDDWFQRFALRAATLDEARVVADHRRHPSRHSQRLSVAPRRCAQ